MTRKDGNTWTMPIGMSAFYQGIDADDKPVRSVPGSGYLIQNTLDANADLNEEIAQAQAMGYSEAYILAGQYVGDGVVIPKNFALRGGWTPSGDRVGHDWITDRPTLVCASTGITIMQGGSADGLQIIRQAAVSIPGDGTAALAGIAAFAGVGVTVAGNDVSVRNTFIMGFATAVVSNGYERPFFSRVLGDCTAGIEITGCMDCPTVQDCHFWPFYVVGLGFATSAMTQRTGTAYNFHDTCDGLMATNNFSYGYKIGMRCTNIALVQLVGNTHDNAYSEMNGNLGLITEGNADITLTSVHSNSADVGVLFNHTTGLVVFGTIDCGQHQRSHVRFGPSTRVVGGGISCGGGSVTACLEFDSGIGQIVIASVALHTSTKAGNAYVFDTADLVKISIGRTTLNSVATVDNIGAGTLAAPALRAKMFSDSGIIENADGSISISVNGLLVGTYRSVASSVNNLIWRSGAAGNPVDMFAEGDDPNIDMRFIPKGTGRSNFLGILQGTNVLDATGQLQALLRTTTTALNDITNAINTTNKFSGKAVINTTTGAIVTAAGATAGAVWLALNGSTAFTPV